MEQHQPEDIPAYVEKVTKLNQAIFYCYNQSSERIPVNIIEGFKFKDHKTLYFNISSLPLTENLWDVFAAELFFYKKNMPFSVILHGIAVVTSGAANERLVEFMIQNADYFEHPIRTNNFLSSLFKPYYFFYRKSSELFSYTFKRKGATSLFN